LPISVTRDGAGDPPELVWESLPAGTKSIAVVVEDPDAPRPEPFVHWIVYGIPPSAVSLDATTLLAARQGKNSALRRGYAPPSPPPGHGVHHYHFQVIALDFPIAYADDVGKRELLATMLGHVLGWGEIVGTYERR
jgi:Raf kinase inhibitor-like YbhB/YbcL family protein